MRAPTTGSDQLPWLYPGRERSAIVPNPYGLGFVYEYGVGVPENYVRAYAWLNLAAAQGYEGAVSRKADLQRRMTTAQIAEAQELSTTLFARINGGG